MDAAGSQADAEIEAGRLSSPLIPAAHCHSRAPVPSGFTADSSLVQSVAPRRAEGGGG